jgi:hypothetical protein
MSRYLGLLFEHEYLDRGLFVHYEQHRAVPLTQSYDRVLMFVVSPIILQNRCEIPYRVMAGIKDQIVNKFLLPLRYEENFDFT